MDAVDFDRDGVADIAVTVSDEHRIAVLLSSAEPVSGSAEGDSSAAGSQLLAPNFPNPFNPQTTPSYTVPERGEEVRVRRSICDAAGGLLRLLVDGPQAPGKHDVVYRGREERGRGLDAGVYYCRLCLEGMTETRPLVPLK